ncbi:hypothetical protein ACQJBY_029093 [Aegilops geniculata]
MARMTKTKAKAKAKAKAKGARNETKHTNNTEWHESEKDYASFDLDLRPEYYEESHNNLMDAIIALLEKEANNENKGVPKGEQKPTKVNGRVYTAAGGAFLVHLLLDDPKKEVVTLLYGLKDLYLKGWNVGAVWYVMKALDVALPPSTQVGFKTKTITSRKGRRHTVKDGVYFLSWSGSYLSLSGGKFQPFFYNAFGKANDKLRDAGNLVADDQDSELQPSVALYAIIVSECVRFPEIESSVIANTTDPLKIIEAPLDEHLIIRMGQWGTGSVACYGANPPEWVRVIKRDLTSHLRLKVEPLYRKKKNQAIVQEVEEPVALRETIQGEGICLMEGLKGRNRFVESFVPDKSFAVRVKVIRLPDTLSETLEEHEVVGEASLLDCEVASKKRRQMLCAVGREVQAASKLMRRKLLRYRKTLPGLLWQVQAVFNQAMRRKLLGYRKTLSGYMQHMCAFGGPNVLLASSSGVTFDKPPTVAASHHDTQDPPHKGKLVPASHDVSRRLGFLGKNSDSGIDEYAAAVWRSIILGFQRATSSGPLCGEALWGLGFIIEPYAFDGQCMDMTSGEEIARTVEQACCEAVLQTKPRVCEMVHRCLIAAPLHHLCNVQDILHESRGLLLMAEGKGSEEDDYPWWMVHAELPAAEVSTLEQKLRRRTSTEVNALTFFSHWVVNPGDPELQGLAGQLVERVRRRKKLE